MASINIQRNPRYALFLILFVFLVFLYLHAPDFQPPPPVFSLKGLPGDEDVKARVAYAEEGYQRMVKNREKLIKKYGPTPDKVAMYVLFPTPCYSIGEELHTFVLFSLTSGLSF